MRNTIIGTAGHVDHGKTQLIKALTGIETDRHKEEKERGITIELGFAYLTLPNGRRCGIIDVPGHEKFIRNMLSGAGSVDLALLVVAADEGVMPQTREHIDILNLLNIKQGVIALTKCDLVDQEWAELVAQDVKQEVKDTFLQDAPIISLSSKTGFGIERLKNTLFDIIMNAPEGEDFSDARLPVDRVFSVEGFGTVVTGTLIEGRIFTGDDLTLYPQMLPVKARSLQVHGKKVESVQKSQRAAVNLSGVKVSDVEKGAVLAAKNSMENSLLLDVLLTAVKGAKRKIENNSRLHFYHGATDLLCRAVLLDKEELCGGQSCYAQLHLENPLAAKAGDRFVARFYSPLETVGGGVILDANPQRRKRGDEKTLKIFKGKDEGSLKQRLSAFILDKSAFLPNAGELKRRVFSNSPSFDHELDELIKDGEIFSLKNALIHKDFFAATANNCEKILQRYHKDNPLLEGMRRDELRAKLITDAPQGELDALINLLQEKGFVNIIGNFVFASGFKAKMSQSHQRLSGEICDLFLRAGFNTPSLDEVAAQYVKEQKTFKQTFDALIASGVLVALTPQIFIHADFYNKAFAAFSALAAQKGEVALGDFRDAIESSRKYAMAILEYFDKKGLTKKEGEGRRLLPQK